MAEVQTRTTLRISAGKIPDGVWIAGDGVTIAATDKTPEGAKLKLVAVLQALQDDFEVVVQRLRREA